MVNHDTDMNKYNFLTNYIGKIVVCRFGDEWAKQRQQFLFNGRITNQNLREILPEEIVIEFDFKKDWNKNSDEYKKARIEAEEYINKIKNKFLELNVKFKITDHEGKSPHLLFNIEGLQYNPEQYTKEYKLRLADDILKNINFKSDLIQLDRSLLISKSKLISLEYQPHFKEEYNGAIEEVIFENSNGKLTEVKKELISQIINDINNSFKIDNKEINSDPIDIKDVDVKSLREIWKTYYIEGNRNALLLAFGGMCRRKGISLENSQKLLFDLLEYVGLSDYYKKTSQELEYSFEAEKVAVFHHLKKIISNENEVKKLYFDLKKCFMKEEDKKYIDVKLCELNASHVGQYVSVDCQITGEQSQKAIPREVIIQCDTCGDNKLISSFKHPQMFILERKDKTMFDELKGMLYCSCTNKEPDEDGKKPTPRKKVIINNYTDHSILYVRDLLVKDEKFIQGNYDPKKIFLIGKELPKTKIINIKGRVFIEEKTKNLSIIASDIKPLKNQISDFAITEDMKLEFKKYFNGTIDLSEEINPDIVGEKRKIAKNCIISLLHSPSQIYDIERKKIIRGGLKVLFYGDTKVGKSEIAKDTSNKGYFELCEYAVMETGSRAGLLYTIDTERGAIIWGVLALNDMMGVVIDGLQNISTEQIGEFREALESQEIIVNRSIKGSALARTRVIGCLNPFKPMNNYIYKCEAITDNFVFKNAPEVTRWDLFIPFCHYDVSSKDISERTSKPRKIPKEIFNNHVSWVWSRKPEQIEYTPSAVQEIKDKSKEMMDLYSLETLPIVHNGIRDIITRLSVSKACELHSTDETHDRIIVEKDHVVKAVDFYEDVFELLELSQFKEQKEGKADISEDGMKVVLSDLNQKELTILREIMSGGKSSTDLSSVLNVSSRSVKDYYEKLKKHELVQTKQKIGICLSVKGVKFMRWLSLGNGEVVKKCFTNKNNGEGKLPYFTNTFSQDNSKKEEIISLIETNPHNNRSMIENNFEKPLIEKMLQDGDIFPQDSETYSINK